MNDESIMIGAGVVFILALGTFLLSLMLLFVSLFAKQEETRRKMIQISLIMMVASALVGMAGFGICAIKLSMFSV